MSDQVFSGKTALVTGGSRGIGRACCMRLSQAGADVAVNYRSNQKAADETVACIHDGGGQAAAVKADVARRDDVDRMIREIEARFGSVDLLVNNAGVFHHVSHDETTPDIWRETFDVNLTGVYNVIWAVKPGMIERGFGRIVNISSISGLRARPACIAYAASKAGLISFTKSLAAALAPHNIRVNCIAPGLIETEILEGVEQSKLDHLIQSTPIQRIGKPEEIAEAMFFLLSEQSSFITGQTLVVSGGRVTLP